MRFYPSKTRFTSYPNGAVGYYTDSQFDALGPYAKVSACPIKVGTVTVHTLTVYATGYADTAWSIPACTKYRGAHVSGFIRSTDFGPEFVVHDRHRHLFEG
jgi:hypothetical protein